MEEPSVLDYLKARLRFWQPLAVDLQRTSGEVAEPAAPPAPAADKPVSQVARLPWRSLLALGLGLAGQALLGPGPERAWLPGAVLLFLAVDALIWSIWKGEWQAAELPALSDAVDPPVVRLAPLVTGLVLALMGFVFLGGLQFNLFNLALLAGAVALVMVAFLPPRPALEEPARPVQSSSSEGSAALNPSSDDATFSPPGEAAVLSPAAIPDPYGEPELPSTRRGSAAPNPYPTEAGDLSATAAPAASNGWQFARQPAGFSVSITRSAVLKALGALGIIAVVVFFRFYRLGDVPPEMNSDHAEKFLDILRILNGEWGIFFPSNGGREGLQFYLAAALHAWAGLPLNFMLLKLVTALIGFASLPFIYLLGKEMGSARIGWLAFLLAGVAYWPNVVSRFGLRLPFYITFSAMLLYFLVHGLRTGRRLDFMLGGIVLGLSFYGYSADRILPLLAVTAVGLFMLHAQSKGRRGFALLSLCVLALISLMLFLPLLRYIIELPDLFLYRTMTRMGSLERPLERSPLIIFIENLGRALAMFSWKNGVVWPISIPDYPALGIVSGALFYLGAAALLVRYLRRGHWLDIFLLLSIPLLMLPSILALAFPDENPNLYRTGGALVPVFVIAAVALDGLFRSIQARLPGKAGIRWAWAVALFLLVFAAVQEYDLVFNTYLRQYRQAAWNSSEMGVVARDFINSVGEPENVWVVGFPNWVDTRLVANVAGYPGVDYELKIENLPATMSHTGPKLFILNPQDLTAKSMLDLVYPQGWFQHVKSSVESKDFLLFIVPASDDQ